MKSGLVAKDDMLQKVSLWYMYLDFTAHCPEKTLWIGVVVADLNTGWFMNSILRPGVMIIGIGNDVANMVLFSGKLSISFSISTSVTGLLGGNGNTEGLPFVKNILVGTSGPLLDEEDAAMLSMIIKNKRLYY